MLQPTRYQKMAYPNSIKVKTLARNRHTFSFSSFRPNFFVAVFNTILLHIEKILDWMLKVQLNTFIQLKLISATSLKVKHVQESTSCK